jgi:hypothetical protein
LLRLLLPVKKTPKNRCSEPGGSVAVAIHASRALTVGR